MSKGRILFADDEARMRELVSDFLTADGFSVVQVSNGKEAVDTFVSDGNIDLVILDIMMPLMNGYEALKRIKEERDVPVILLTAKTGEYDELKGFNVGTDEYIKKPFRPKILVARVNALLKRSATSKDDNEVLSSSGIVLDFGRQTVSVDGNPVDLTVKEFELLAYFIRNKSLALSRDKILENVWDYDYLGDERTVDTHVKKLRSKLGEKGSLIKTVWAFGYKFEDA